MAADAAADDDNRSQKRSHSEYREDDGSGMYLLRICDYSY